VVAKLHCSRRFGGYNTACGSDAVTQKARDNLEELSEDGRILYKSLPLRNELGGVQWIDLAQGRDNGRAVLNMIMELWTNVRRFFTS
jgi:hypothetical protein